MRHCDRSDYYLRHWLFQASKDNTNWQTLKEHKNDKSLNKANATKTWIVSNCNEFYKYFRIKMTAKNDMKQNVDWSLMCSDFEIYGEIIGDPFNIEPKRAAQIHHAFYHKKNVNDNTISVPLHMISVCILDSFYYKHSRVQHQTLLFHAAFLEHVHCKMEMDTLKTECKTNMYTHITDFETVQWSFCEIL